MLIPGRMCPPGWWRWWMRPIVVSGGSAVFGVFAAMSVAGLSSWSLSGYVTLFVMLMGLACVLSCMHIGGALGGRRGQLYAIVIPVVPVFVTFAAFVGLTDAIVGVALLLCVLMPSYAIHRLSLRLATVVAAVSYGWAFSFTAWGAYPDSVSSYWPAVLLSTLGAMTGVFAVPAPEGTWLHYFRSLPVHRRFSVARMRRRSEAYAFGIKSGVDERVAETIASVAESLKLWPTEVRSITLELLAHFEDAARDGQSAEDAIFAFGDPREAARLATRAKKRCRPPLWHAWIWSFRGAGAIGCLFIAVYIYSGIRFWTAKPNIAVDYLDVLMEPIHEMPEEDRAWREWIELWAKGPTRRTSIDTYTSGEGRAFELDILSYGLHLRDKSIPADVWKEYSAKVNRIIPAHALRIRELAATRPVLGWPFETAGPPEEYDRMLLKRDGVPFLPRPIEHDPADPIQGSLTGVLLPHLTEQRWTAFVLAVDMDLSVKNNDPTRYLANLDAMMVIADQPREIPIVLNQLISLYNYHLAFSHVTKTLSERIGFFDEPQLEYLESILTETPAIFEFSLEGLHCMMLDTFQRIYSDNGRGNGIMTPQGLDFIEFFDQMGTPIGTTNKAIDEHSTVLLGPVNALFYGSREETLELYDELMDQHRAAMRLEPWNRTLVDSMNQRLEELKSSQGGLHAFRYAILHLLLPSLEGATNQADVHYPTWRNAALIATQLLLYKQHNNTWPGSLEQLTLAGFASVPLDRFDGKPLRYQTTSLGPLLYSVGADRDDDGGVWIDAVSKVTSWSPSPSPDADGDWILFRLGSIEPTEQELQAMEDNR